MLYTALYRARVFKIGEEWPQGLLFTSTLFLEVEKVPKDPSGIMSNQQRTLTLRLVCCTGLLAADKVSGVLTILPFPLYLFRPSS